MMNHWLFRCKDITEMISKSMDEKPSLNIRIGIKLHLMVCYLCTRYKKQLELIQTAIGKLESDEISGLPAKKLPDQVKNKIKKLID